MLYNLTEYTRLRVTVCRIVDENKMERTFDRCVLQQASWECLINWKDNYCINENGRCTAVCYIVSWCLFRNNETPLTNRIDSNKRTFKFTCVTNANFQKLYFYLLFDAVIESETGHNKKMPPPLILVAWPGWLCMKYIIRPEGKILRGKKLT